MVATALGVLRRLSPRRFWYKARVCADLDGLYPRQCPICGHIGRFPAYGFPPRYDAQCPRCLSLERHRLLFLADRKLKLLDRARSVLHFAPEPAIRDWVTPRVDRYVSADLNDPGADRREDIESLTLANDGFDVVICSHVLEHVDDTMALAEIRRVLRPDGLLIAMVPLIEAWPETYENASATTDALRALHFGQADHLRYYGRDFRDHLRAAGFDIDEFRASPQQCVVHAILRGETVFLCRPRPELPAI